MGRHVGRCAARVTRKGNSSETKVIPGLSCRMGNDPSPVNGNRSYIIHSVYDMINIVGKNASTERTLRRYIRRGRVLAVDFGRHDYDGTTKNNTY